MNQDAKAKALTDGGEVTLRGVRLSFADLWKPVSMKPEQPKQFGATFLMLKGSDNEKAVRAKIIEVAKAKWGAKADEVLDVIEGDTQLCCFIDGDHKKKKKLDGYSGNWSLSAKNKRQPTVLMRDGTQASEGAQGAPYSGCYVNAKVEIWAQDNENGKAIRCSLLGVVFSKDGDAFGGGRVASADELSDLTSDEDEGETGKGML